MYVVYRLLGFIPSGKRPQKNIKDLNKEFPNLNRKDSALQIVNYAEEFRDRFWRIKGMQAYPDEQEKIITGEKTNIFVMRRDNARESFKQLYECFELYKFQFNCRKELRDSINEMWSIFKPYSDKLDFWSDQKSPLEKQMKRVDEIVEKISQLLAPYVNAPLISSERFEKILKFEERKKNESKK